jgi:hypothetical protein
MNVKITFLLSFHLLLQMQLHNMCMLGEYNKWNKKKTRTAQNYIEKINITPDSISKSKINKYDTRVNKDMERNFDVNGSTHVYYIKSFNNRKTIILSGFEILRMPSLFRTCWFVSVLNIKQKWGHIFEAKYQKDKPFHYVDFTLCWFYRKKINIMIDFDFKEFLDRFSIQVDSPHTFVLFKFKQVLNTNT